MEWKEIGMATNNHFKICWPAKIPNRDNSEDKGLNMLKAGLSGQHLRPDRANCAPLGAVATKSLRIEYSWWCW
jgi:hypothetical protein